MSFRKYSSGHCLVSNFVPEPVLSPMRGRAGGNTVPLEKKPGLVLRLFGEVKDVFVARKGELSHFVDDLWIALLVLNKLENVIDSQTIGIGGSFIENDEVAQFVSPEPKLLFGPDLRGQSSWPPFFIQAEENIEFFTEECEGVFRVEAERPVDEGVVEEEFYAFRVRNPGNMAWSIFLLKGWEQRGCAKDIPLGAAFDNQNSCRKRRKVRTSFAEAHERARFFAPEMEAVRPEGQNNPLLEGK